jgi:hypothetical protein
MGFQCTLPTAVLVVTLTALCPAPERFGKGWLKGFTKSPTEHIIDEPSKPFTLRAVRGIVLDPSGAEMDGVIVATRDEAGRIRGTKTNRNGPFKLGGVPKLFSTTIQV